MDSRDKKLVLGVTSGAELWIYTKCHRNHPLFVTHVALTVLWTLKSDREAISLSNSSVADVADGFAELD